MKRQDFIKRYNGADIVVRPSYSMTKDYANRMVAIKQQLSYIAEKAGLKFFEKALTGPDITFRCFLSSGEGAVNTNRYLFEVLVEDFTNMTPDESELVELLKRQLNESKIKCERLVKSSITTDFALRNGFMQSYTSVEWSYWFHRDGRKIVFHRGNGTYVIYE